MQLKNISKILMILFLLGGIIMILLPVSWFPSFYDVRYSGWTLIVYAFVIYLLPKLFHSKGKGALAKKKNEASEMLQFLAVIVFLADSLGMLGFYELYRFGIPYSYVTHATMPLLATVILAIFIKQYFDITPTYSILLALSVVILMGIAWEVIENLSDYFLATHLTGPSQTDATNVSLIDIYIDIWGAIIGSLICVSLLYIESKRAQGVFSEAKK